ncbi:glycoside hydrolase family 3 C-terminal domain-containing protein [Flaviramulus sp. BrNp1-15]|uniref:glycoside hydrolase family 3 C-terminal domain-containing protein n=1 Tax=Flaviramulus sp. BrNp1-15 TaxID=2916754 RepID=UPI001EE8365E|nr:glycoside hydrolase family 3 C-terminal domain-containing protein [Flaviramulus sp. BrNp1-15]ULC60708.1 glycoside hydrolase family 3 C-terminal domain-containing protein [Flaviramulus sp. BrNp1-15]
MKTILKVFPRTILLAVILISSCKNNNSDAKSEESGAIVSSEEAKFPFYDTTLSMDDRIQDLISRLTLEEKADQMMHNTNAIERLEIPPYSYWNEALHGVARSGVATVFPQAIGLGATFDSDLAFRVSSAISDEARAMHNAAKEKGYHKQYGGLTFWTPNINIFRDPRWGRGQETYGEDPYLMSLMGKAFVNGLQGDNDKYLKTAACAKHYAVHSGPEELRHEFDAIVNQKDLWETYLPAFEALVKEAKVESIMCAYNSTNGEPCCANKYLIEDVLLGEWNFKGHILSDCWAIVDFYTPKGKGGHGTTNTQAEASAMAVKSSVSLNCGSSYLEGLPEAVKQGLITEAEIDEKLAILLRTRFKLGLFDPQGSNPYDDISVDVVNSDEHRALAREVAQKSIVLLKNNGVLPLKNDLPKYFITGPIAGDSEALLGNYYGVNPKMVTIMEGIAGAISPASQLQYRMGAMLTVPKENPLDYATGNAGNSDVTFAALGISGLIEGEEGASIASKTKGDRLDYNLPKSQMDYLRGLRQAADRNPEDKKPIVAIITGGSPMNLAEVEALADAVLLVWYPGEEGGNAIADVLFGKVSPSGRLPITFPKSLDQLPDYKDYSMKGRTYKYMNLDPLYPFGFGLSYTTFKYDNIKLSSSSISKTDTITLTVDITNSGKVDADEVVQLYISDVEASFVVPNSQLNDVKRIHLKAGETKNISFELTPKMFEMVNNEGKRVIESGAFKVYVGGASPMKRSQELGVSKMAEASFSIQ